MPKQSISFIIPGACVPKGRPRVTFQHGRAFAYTPPRTRHYADLARTYALNERNKTNFQMIPKPGTVKMTVEFTLNRKVTARPDLFNLLCQIADTLQGILYEDDSQITEVVSTKTKGSIPMTEVTVEALT